MAGTLTTEDLEAIWDRYQAGITPAKIARDIGRDRDAVRLQINAAGGIRPTIPRRADRHLTLEEREEISRGLAGGQSCGMGSSPEHQFAGHRCRVSRSAHHLARP